MKKWTNEDAVLSASLLLSTSWHLGCLVALDVHLLGCFGCQKTSHVVPACSSYSALLILYHPPPFLGPWSVMLLSLPLCSLSALLLANIVPHTIKNNMPRALNRQFNHHRHHPTILSISDPLSLWYNCTSTLDNQAWHKKKNNLSVFKKLDRFLFVSVGENYSSAGAITTFKTVQGLDCCFVSTFFFLKTSTGRVQDMGGYVSFVSFETCEYGGSNDTYRMNNFAWSKA